MSALSNVRRLREQRLAAEANAGADDITLEDLEEVKEADDLSAASPPRLGSPVTEKEKALQSDSSSSRLADDCAEAKAAPGDDAPGDDDAPSRSVTPKKEPGDKGGAAVAPEGAAVAPGDVPKAVAAPATRLPSPSKRPTPSKAALRSPAKSAKARASGRAAPKTPPPRAAARTAGASPAKASPAKASLKAATHAVVAAAPPKPRPREPEEPLAPPDDDWWRRHLADKDNFDYDVGYSCEGLDRDGVQAMELERSALFFDQCGNAAAASTAREAAVEFRRRSQDGGLTAPPDALLRRYWTAAVRRKSKWGDPIPDVTARDWAADAPDDTDEPCM